jgi:hypothetical protein
MARAITAQREIDGDTVLDRLGTRLGSDRSGRRCREPIGLNAGQRMAQTIAARDERGEADTEELRKAVVHTAFFSMKCSR